MKWIQLSVASAFLISLTTSLAWSQAEVTIPVEVRLAGDSSTVNFGYDRTATYCLDPPLGEAEAPPTLWAVFDARFTDPRGYNETCIGSYNDFRTWLATPTIDTFQLSFEGTPGSTQWNVSWPAGLSSMFTSLTLKEAIFGFITYDMLTVTSANLANNIRNWYIISTPVINGVHPDDIGLPGEFALNQNYPNPFNPSTTIRFNLPHDATVTLKIYNVFGQEVATLANQQRFMVGENSVDFNAANLPSGVYYYRIMVNYGKYQDVKKMVLIK
jgi:hypothetical protein